MCFFFFPLSVVICCLARSATTAALSRRLHFCVKNDLDISAQPFGSTMKVHDFFLSQSFPSAQLCFSESVPTEGASRTFYSSQLPPVIHRVEDTAQLCLLNSQELCEVSFRSVSSPVDAFHYTAAQLEYTFSKNPAVGIKVTYFRAKQIKIFIITLSRLCWNEGDDENKTNLRKQNKPHR